MAEVVESNPTAILELNKIAREMGVSSINDNWLLRLLDSPLFSEWIAVSYLFKQEHSGVRDYICNRMYSLPLTKIEGYLFQLCYMLVHKPSSSLEKYVSDMCSRSLKIAVKVYWFLLAGAEDVDDPEEIFRLQERCQTAALKGDWPLMVLSLQSSDTSCSGTGRLPNLLSACRALSVTNAPSLQKLPASISSPYGVDETTIKALKTASKESGSSLKSIKRLLRRSRVCDSSSKTLGEKEENSELISEEEKGSLCRKLFPDKDDVERALPNEEQAKPEKESCNRHTGNPKLPVDDAEAFLRELCKTPHCPKPSRGKKAAGWEENEGPRWSLFRKRLKVHPEGVLPCTRLESSTEVQLEKCGSPPRGFKHPLSDDLDAKSPGSEFPLTPYKENEISYSVIESPLSQSSLLKLFLRKRTYKTIFKETVESISPLSSTKDEVVEYRISKARNASCKVKGLSKELSISEDVDTSNVRQESLNARVDTEMGLKENTKSMGSDTDKQLNPGKLFSSTLTPWSLSAISTYSSRRGSSKKRTRKKPSEPQTLESFRLRNGAFSGTLDFIQSLCDISTGLVVFPPEDRPQALNESLSRLNSYLTSAESKGGVCFPMGKGCYRLLYIPEEEAVLMNSRERAPFLVCFEVLGCGDDGLFEFEDQKNVGRTAILSSGSKANMLWPLLPWRRRAHFLPDMQGDCVKHSQESCKCTTPDKHVYDTEKSNSSEDERPGSLDTPEDSPMAQNSGFSHTHRDVSQDSMAITLKAFSGLHITDAEVSPSGKNEQLQASKKASEENEAKVMSGKDVENITKKICSRSTPVECVGPDSKSAVLAGELWERKKERIKKASKYGALATWDLRSAIVKSGDNCRQEHLALQLVSHFYSIFQQAGAPLWLRPYEILVTSSLTALIETIPDTASIHAIKKRFPQISSLREFFSLKYGNDSPLFHLAQKNFVESMAGYSIVSYILQVKDRHNGNLLLDEDGHIIHVDFGFMLSNSPGGVNFESAPFKLNRELLEVMDSDAEGSPSEYFDYFKVLCIQGYLICRRHAERFILLVEMMQDSGCPCFRGGHRTINKLRRRFRLSLTEEKCVSFVLSLISRSLDSWRTRQYDYYQRVLNGIL
ncbi:hypothetical protein O6H91_01G014900 [Diphasiastrum complanatum]|uniref:Uncharacterized protein n=1 Tax=Diphasiastrum complanatum TaxID=34168 RepID=A0ACC2ENH1_DIPCM|nr:hypothetical protein O6H91_01G014900 [Diphasiastrum complanatum]